LGLPEGMNTLLSVEFYWNLLRKCRRLMIFITGRYTYPTFSLYWNSENPR
jgi:hypothetical protein